MDMMDREGRWAYLDSFKLTGFSSLLRGDSVVVEGTN